MSKILLVDDNIDMLDTLEHLFSFLHYDVLRAENGQAGIKIAEAEQPGIIILDALMPIMNGFEACKTLKSNEKTRDIPVIFLSANYTSENYQSQGLQMGADAYLVKPFNPKELISKVNKILHHRKMLDQLRSKNKKMMDEISHRHTQNGTTTEHRDLLTGLYNKAFLNDEFEKIFAASLTQNQKLSIFIADVDHFQKINAYYSEQIGDYILAKLANLILTEVDEKNYVVRLNKNRFLVALKETSEDQAFQLAEKIRHKVTETEFLNADFFLNKRQSSRKKSEAPNISISIGVTELRNAKISLEMIITAENALFSAKTSGRNKTVRPRRTDLPN